MRARSADPEGFWAEAAREIDWIEPAEKDLRCLDGDLRPLVCRRRGQHLLQRARPPCRQWTRRPGRADPRFAAGKVGLEVHLCRDAARSADARRRDAGFRRRQGRSRHPLYADGVGSRDRDAGLRADRRGAFGGVRRLRRQGTGDADRGRQTETDLFGELRLEPGRIVHYKPLLDEAIRLSSVKPETCIILQRPQQGCDLAAGRDHDWASLRRAALDAGQGRALRRRCWRPIRSTFSTPRAPPESPRAWCATMAGIWSR